MNLALAQFKTSTNYKDNLKKILKYTKQAKEQNADLIIFPETSHIYATKNFKNIAQTIDDEFVQTIIKASNDYQIGIVFGFFEKENHNVKNSVIFADLGKIIYKYSKTHLYDAFGYDESKDIQAGDNIKSFDTRWGKMGIMVCYELRFPEIARTLALDGAKIILTPTAWVNGKYKKQHYEILTKARALENTVFLCVANQTQNIYTGNSCIINPLGQKIAKLKEEEGMTLCHINFDMIEKTREKLPCINQRRRELYKL